MFLNAIVMFAVLNELGTSWKCHGRKIHGRLNGLCLW